MLMVLKYLTHSIVFLPTHHIWSTIRLFVWRFNKNFQYISNFETSAHVQRIIWRSKRNFNDPVHPRNFLGYSLGFAHPKRVLNDNAILTCVNDKEAYFLEMNHPLRHYTADKVPFCFITLFEDALNLISIPIVSFHKIADSLGRITNQCMIISHPCRTGSTLLTKLIQLSSLRVLALSEPDTLFHLAELEANKNMSDLDWNRIVKSTLLLLFKPIPFVDAIIIKERGETIRLQKCISEICPEIHHVFIQRRDNWKAVQSLQRIVGGVLMDKLIYTLSKNGLLVRFIPSKFFIVSPTNVLVYRNAFKFLDMTSLFELCLCHFAILYKSYVDTRQHIDFTVLYFEDLLTDTEREIRNVFKLLKIEPETLKNALINGLKDDSQKNTPLSQMITNSHPIVEYAGDVKERCDRFMDSLDLPKFSD